MRLSVKLLLCFINITLFVNCKKIDKKQTENWISLFNGKDLHNWVIKINGYPLHHNYKNTFRVENGILKVSYDNYENFTNQFGHIFYKTPFTNYKFRLEYRFVGEQVKGGAPWAEKNSGIMIYCQSPESMLVHQAFPLSLEVQLLGGVNKNEPRPTGNLCTPATNVKMNGKLITAHCITAIGETFYDTHWITAEVHVINNTITHYINGKAVITYSNPTIGGEFLDATSKVIQAKEGQALTNGYISLQSESHPVEFKNIEILEL